MTQNIGETRDAIIDDNNKRISLIVDKNKDRKVPYYIVLFAKEVKGLVDGKYAIRQHIKAYSKKPRSQVGMVIGEVNNQTGKIAWEVNLPQKPFDFNKLQIYGAKSCDEVVMETTTIPFAYVCQ